MEYLEEMPLRKPFLLAKLVSFEPGQLTSKILAQADSFTLTLYAIMAGDTFAPGHSRSICLAQILQGKAKINISGKCFETDAGQSIIIPPGTNHSFTAIVSSKILLTMIS